ncbi:ROK family protein [Vibrio furnissii]|uniref:ROK family protein n=1 Tax=Vibrio furnissii TaxID=29494 RepID=UPI001EEA32C5|nr:ROK family protein [Vibrio furnissii]MCG6230501.1 ROK family protein [Vibrio furnissii]MCG6234480.1 ROK family protein [Vibrio furnissii]MCG6259473.1 ROK family protein [Vibrio furnissii]
MKLGLSVDSEWVRSVLFDSNKNLIYRNQQKTLHSPQSTTDLIIKMARSMQRMFGPFTQIGLTVMPDCWQADHKESKAELAQSITAQLAIPCHLFEPAVIALTQVGDLPKGNILSAVLDDGCDLCVADELWHRDPEGNVLDLCWAHQPLKGYESLIDGITPLCWCGSDECVRQYVSQKGVERQYHQLSLQSDSASHILNGTEDTHGWSARIYRIWVDQLARALCDPVTCFRPALLILSGSLILRRDLALTLKSSLSRYCPCEVLPEIVCLCGDEFRFAQGASSIHSVKTLKRPTFESRGVLTLTGKIV